MFITFFDSIKLIALLDSTFQTSHKATLTTRYWNEKKLLTYFIWDHPFFPDYVYFYGSSTFLLEQNAYTIIKWFPLINVFLNSYIKKVNAITFYELNDKREHYILNVSTDSNYCYDKQAIVTQQIHSLSENEITWLIYEEFPEYICLKTSTSQV